VCWRERGGVIEVLVIDSIPTNPAFRREVQVKFPGGGGEFGETPEAAARREFREEVGLRIREKTPLSLIYAPRCGRHDKFGFLFERNGCRGSISKADWSDGDSRIANRRFVSIEEAKDIVYRTSRNMTQLFLAVYAEREIERILKYQTLQSA
jgi:8-oxo-dGTP pyrophosphatase MutT (NUDIX family)